MRPGNIGAGEARAITGGGSHMVCVAGNPDHRMDDGRRGDHIFGFVERQALETEAAGQFPILFAAKG